MRTHYKEHIDTELEPDHNWQQSRRSWLKTMLLGGIAVQLPWLQSCDIKTETTPEQPQLDGQDIFKPLEMENIHCLHNIIVPADGNGPSAADVESANYFAWMLVQPLYVENSKTYFIDNWIKISDLCKETYQVEIKDLTPNQQQAFMLTLTESGWTRSFISKMTSVIFEAMLFDPIYGFNPNGIGWEWLEVTPGQPRANEQTKYPEFLKTIDTQYG
jgi:gluconate 2-dehydrogenase gamma chain